MATYVNDLRLKEIGTGESSGTWGTETNVNLELIGEALGYGTEGITTNANTHTTTVADGSTDPGRAMYIEYTGTLDSACTITIAPNTLSRLHYIENGTSGSQNIIIKQGSGATITIPPGDTKAVYLDGAGSGAKVVDVFASFSVVDLKVQDDLTVTDDVAIGGLATVGGTLGVTGILTCTDDIIIGDGKTIGSASDVDSMTIAANGQVTFTQTLIGTALDISGDIDVDGTSNLDIVDIDGAVDMASTLQVDGAITNSSTIVSTGKITADAGIDIDNINIDGTTIALSSGDLTLDVAGDINLDADGADINLKDGGTAMGRLGFENGDLNIASSQQDYDIKLKGNDGGAVITALTLDMSDAGRATFNNKASFNNPIAVGQSTFSGGSVLADFHGSGSGVGAQLAFANDHNTSKFFVGLEGNTSGDGFLYQQQDADINFYTNNTLHAKLHNDGAFVTTPTAGGHAVFNEGSVDADFRVESDGNTHMLFVDGGANHVGIGQVPSDAYLHIKGNFETDYALKFNNTQGNASAEWGFRSHGTNGESLAFYDVAANEQYLAFSNSGTEGVVFNQDSLDIDFRVESNGLSHMLFVDASVDRIGIGTSSPDHSLDVDYAFAGATVDCRVSNSDNSNSASGARIISTVGGSSSGDPRLVVGITGVQEYCLGIDNSDGDTLKLNNGSSPSTGTNFMSVVGNSTVVFNDGSADVDFRVESNANSHMLFVDGGNNVVNIGTGTAPHATLTVANSADGTEAAPQMAVRGAASNYTLSFFLDGTAAYIGQNSASRNLRLYSGAETAGVNLANGGTSFGTFSDERLKENIQDIGSVIEKIKDIRCVTFNRTDVEDAQETIGFIAQDFVGKFDQVLDESKVLDTDEETRYSIKYTETIPVLLKAIQEQQTLIESLTARITTLEG